MKLQAPGYLASRQVNRDLAELGVFFVVGQNCKYEKNDGKMSILFEFPEFFVVVPVPFLKKAVELQIEPAVLFVFCVAELAACENPVVFGAWNFLQIRRDELLQCVGICFCVVIKLADCVDYRLPVDQSNFVVIA